MVWSARPWSTRSTCIRTLTEYPFCAAPAFRGLPAHPGVYLFSRALRTPSLQSTNDPTPMASGSSATPISIPFKPVTNSDSTPSGLPARGRWIGPLRRTPPPPTKVQGPQAPNISEVVSESTKLDLDAPTALPTPRNPSRSSSEPSDSNRPVQQICHLIIGSCSPTTPRPACPTVFLPCR